MKILQNFKKANGITLVALVVTIVVLLILAGVSLNLVLGENGIIAKARDARDVTEQDALDTQTALNSLYNEMEAAINGGSAGGTKPYLPSSDFNQVEGTDLDTGLVIEDNLGNQYVWIEVPNDGTGPDYTAAGVSKKEEYTDTDYTNIENALKTYTTYYGDIDYTDTYSSDEATGLTQIEYNNLKNKMLKSVYENGGFYIGRYEAGIETYRTNKNDTIADDLKPLSKANQYPLNFVTCRQAQMLAQRVAPTGYNSSLMFGVQWDLVLKYLETKGVSQTLLTVYGRDWGNYYNIDFEVSNSKASYSEYSGKRYNLVGNTTYTKPYYADVLLTTGANETRNSIKNICDLAGNVEEYTLEDTSDSRIPCVLRGSHCRSDGSAKTRSCFAANYDYEDYSTKDGAYVGFRVALY